MIYKSLLGVSNAKTSKGESLGYLTGILYLAPSNMVKGINVCKFASNGCRKACLFTAGRGKFKSVEQARINKTIFFRDNQTDFFYSLEKDINKVIKKALRENLKPVIRLNGTSDISWEDYKVYSGKNIFEKFPDIQFYDYTKNYNRLDALKGAWKNYHLTFSISENKKNQLEGFKLLDENKVSLAMVFNNVPKTWSNTKVIDGDKHDLRFLDGKGIIVGLKSKGKAKKDLTGFVF